MSEVKETYKVESEEVVKDFAVFDGADAVVEINGKPVPFVQKIFYKECLKRHEDRESTGIIRYHILGTSEVKEAIYGSNDDLRVLFKNELGYEMTMIFANFCAKTAQSEICADTEILTEDIHFTFSHIIHIDTIIHYEHDDEEKNLSPGGV